MKLLMRTELENFYNLRRGNSVGILASVYATSADSVAVSELEENFIISVKHCDSENINVFVVVKEELDEKRTLTFKGEDVELFVSTAMSDFIVPKGKKEEYLIFLDPSMHKCFSTWLFELASEVYITMTGTGATYISNAVFKYSLSLERYLNYLYYDKLGYIVGSKRISLNIHDKVKAGSATMEFMKSLPDVYVNDHNKLIPISDYLSTNVSLVNIKDGREYEVISSLSDIKVVDDDLLDDFIEEVNDNEKYLKYVTISIRINTESV